MGRSIRLSFKILKLFGWWQDGNQSWGYFIYGYSMNFFLIEYLIIAQVVYICSIQNIEQLIAVLGLFLTMIGLFAKSVNFLVKIKKIVQSVADLEDLLQYSENPLTADRIRIKKKARFIFNFFRAYCITALLSVTNENITTLRTHEGTLKFGVNYVDGESNIGFFVFSVCMSLNYYISTTIALVFDLFPVFLMGYAIGLVEELTEVLGEIKTNEELVKCVKIHNKIKKFVKDIQDHYSAVIMLQSLISSVIFCTCSYLLSTVSSNF